ncbi:MAG: Hsp20/alpha crystallin family protein [Sphingobacteriales bacterium]|nr:MAG: Hsp20/alpha crystallin family protein [Sphingobacteriales bacterium]
MTNIMKKENGNRRAATEFGGLMDHWFDSNINRFFDENFRGARSLPGSRVPANIRETDQSYELEVVAPGLKKEDFKIQVVKDLLTISVERQQQESNEAPDGSWVRREYHTQSFSRSFGLDESVDTNKIAARYQDGILHLSMPKKEGARNISRTIEIE